MTDDLPGEQQSPAMDEFQERLRKEGLEISWQPIYNAGVNPVASRLRTADIAKPVVQGLLRATFQILRSGATDGQNATRSAKPTQLEQLQAGPYLSAVPEN